MYKILSIVSKNIDLNKHAQICNHSMQQSLEYGWFEGKRKARCPGQAQPQGKDTHRIKTHPQSKGTRQEEDKPTWRGPHQRGGAHPLGNLETRTQG